MANIPYCELGCKIYMSIQIVKFQTKAPVQASPLLEKNGALPFFRPYFNNKNGNVSREAFHNVNKLSSSIVGLCLSLLKSNPFSSLKPIMERNRRPAGQKTALDAAKSYCIAHSLIGGKSRLFYLYFRMLLSIRKEGIVCYQV
jgi:hypothetical protein